LKSLRRLILLKEFDNKVFIGIVDVLGHGENADEIAMAGLFPGLA
jgi:serine phosphatase RsbU (regulator of sigma subunit)